MNRTKLKNYAPQARREFIQAVTQRAAIYGLTPKKIEPIVEKGDVAIIGGQPFPKAIAAKRKKLEERIKRDGFEQTMEALAYTWFNRFVAIRYMELHEYLEHGYRVLSQPDPAKTTPEILEQAEHVALPGVKKDKVVELKLAGDREAELYRLLLVAQCNALHSAMPFLFEKIDDETELVLPENLLHSDSILRKLVSGIDEEDWQQVEILGWLYQFYISEKKGQVIGKVVKSEDIPAATQLFTPNWIVKYLVQNTLGRQWLATYPQSALRQQMEYYIEPAEQTPEVQEQLKTITPESLNPEELTLLDPACGSGHILVEAYDLFKAIYQERGYRAKDIPALILRKNLFGIEIDDRAAQLAAFALMMKARADDRRIFDGDAKPNVVAIQESEGLDAAELTHALNSPISKDDRPQEYLFEEIQEAKEGLFSKKALAENGHVSQADVASLLSLFQNGKTFGSLIQVPPTLAEKLPEIEKRLDDVLKFGDLTHASVHVLKPLLQQALLLARQYDAVVANPPYMSARSGMNTELKSFVRSRYPASKSDLFAVFIDRASRMANAKGTFSLITMHSWMFLSSYADMRRSLLTEHTLSTLAHLGPRAFDSISGEVVTVAAFSFIQTHVTGYVSTCFRLTEESFDEKRRGLAARKNPFFVTQDDLSQLPESPVAYWASQATIACFRSLSSFGHVAETAVGLFTCDNERFLRCWWEVNYETIGFGITSRQSAQQCGRRYFPYNKGGGFRPWYGLGWLVVQFDNDGLEIRRHRETSGQSYSLPGEQHYFRPGITWSGLTSGINSFRASECGFLFDSNKGQMAFTKDDRLYLGLLNSACCRHFVELINPTLSLQSNEIKKLPVIAPENPEQACEIVSNLVNLYRADWDSAETSWDFGGMPTIADNVPYLGQSYDRFLQSTDRHREQAKGLTERNNQIFIRSFGLEGEISPNIPDHQITLYQPDREEDIKRLVSYAVGCIMGRYSLDEPGLILANQGETQKDYLRLVSSRFEAIDAGRAIEEPDSVALDPSKGISCFACGKVEAPDRARFVIAGEADGDSLRGRPLIYCQECCDVDRASYVTFGQPLKSFSVSQTLEREWCERGTLKAFLELAGCFGHRVPLQKDEVKFLCDDDGIVPLLEADWGIRDDAVNRFIELVSVAWPKEHLEENLKFVADSLGPSAGEQPRETIRRYLATGFFKHHLSTYKKRPIYWLFSSGKQRAFQCLVYLHRYHEGTLARMRTEYVIPLQGKIAARIEQLASDALTATSTSHRKKLEKERDKLLKQQVELQVFDEKLRHYADQRITLDLDDGVKVNYAKFGDLLAEVKAVTGGKSDEE